MALPHGITHGLASAAQRNAMDQLGVERMGASKVVPDFLIEASTRSAIGLFFRSPREMGCRVALIIQLR
jgi:hypothetical protein